MSQLIVGIYIYHQTSIRYQPKSTRQLPKGEAGRPASPRVGHANAHPCPGLPVNDRDVLPVFPYWQSSDSMGSPNEM